MNTTNNAHPSVVGEQIVEFVRELRRRTDAATKAHDVRAVAAVADDLANIDDAAILAADVTIARQILDITSDLTSAGEWNQLEPLLRRAVRNLSGHRHATVRDRFLSLNNLAALYDSKADGCSRDEVLSTLLAQASQLTDPIDSETSVAFFELGQIYESAGHARPSAILYGHVYRYAMSAPDVRTDSRLAAVECYGRALTNDGRPEESLRMYDEAAVILKKDADFDAKKELALFGYMIRTAQIIGDPTRTTALFERARNFVEKTNQKDSMHAFAIYHSLAVLYFQSNDRGHYKEAEGLLEHALAILSSFGRQSTSDYANEVAQLAAIVNANGRPDRAEVLYRESLSIYEKADHGDPSVSSDFLTDAGNFYLDRHRFGDAVAAFKKAQELRQLITNLTVEKRANTLSNLATACFEDGDLAEATRWYRQAIDTRHQSVRQAPVGPS